ncbi:hypothetical protein F2Q69_00005989 [Brassica cretica]|uniref:Uncharacterized protein n=1 Tax=Brassica cretica TaxID=69181 RepID=A0A8S9NPE9_BRACR|nr:hypothetical protein F2Q69_00005989 [Brassica cretica]
MVDLSICCSEHDVSMCFSEHERTLRMSWRPWPEPVSRVVDVLQPVEEGLLGVKFRLGGCGVDELWSWTSWTPFFRINYSAWKLEGGGRDPDPGEGIQTRGRNPELGGKNLEAGSWRYNMVFFIGLHELHRSIKFLVEFGDETLPQWWGLVGVGRNFDGEAGNVCIKGDASAHTPDACAAPVSILGLSSSRTSVCISRGSLNRVEECMGQDPRISERENLGEAKD